MPPEIPIGLARLQDRTKELEDAIREAVDDLKYRAFTASDKHGIIARLEEAL